MAQHDTNTNTTDSDAPPDKWHPASIKRALPDVGLNDHQEEMLATAVRNPNATPAAVGEHTDASGSLVRNAIRRLATGGYEDDVVDHHTVLTKGHDAFLERTLKQRAAIHWLAKHPNGLDTLTTENAADHAEDELGVAMHPSVLYYVQNNYPDVLAKRRRWVGDDTEPVDSDDTKWVGKAYEPVYKSLAEAGVEEFPDENLDGLEPADDRHERIADVRAEILADARDEREIVDSGGEGGDGSAAADGAADAADRTTERSHGNGQYRGPPEGLDLAGPGPSYLVDTASEGVDESVRQAVDDLAETVGEFGEHATDREVSVDDLDDLEHELRVLHLLVSWQGRQLKAYREVLDNLNVTVEVGYDGPE